MRQIQTELSLRDSGSVSPWRPFKFVAHLPLHSLVSVCDVAKIWSCLSPEATLYPLGLPEQQ